MATKKSKFKYDKRASKEVNVKNAMKSINDEFGKGTIYTLGSKYEVAEIPRVSTGIEQLDEILGGGLPVGRIVEVFGPESAGKTSLAYHLMSCFEYALDIPIEGTFDKQRAQVFGNEPGQLFVSRANTGEDALKAGYTFTKGGGDIVVIDSVPSMITKNEFEEEDFDKAKQPGRIAALLSSKLPKIVPMAEQMGTTWVFVNQLRDEIGGMLFGPQTHTPGGRALRHYCSLRIQINRTEFIKIPNKYSNENSAKDLTIGIVCKLRVVKSKVCNPYGECMIPMFFDRGFVSFDEVDDIKKEHRKREKLKFEKKHKEKDEESED